MFSMVKGPFWPKCTFLWTSVETLVPIPYCAFGNDYSSYQYLNSNILRRIEKNISLYVCKLTHPILVDSVRQGTPVDKAHPPFQSTVLQHRYPLVEVCYDVPLQCAGQPPFPPAAPHRLIRRIFHTILCKPTFGHTTIPPTPMHFMLIKNRPPNSQHFAFLLIKRYEDLIAPDLVYKVLSRYPAQSFSHSDTHFLPRDRQH